jgi:8-hydroxy-5-deazaflavin:NADPH oxidoreductase
MFKGAWTMTIAIIGTGNMAAGLARRLAEVATTDVVIGARDPEKAAKLARSTGANWQSGGIAAAAALADVIVLAVHYGIMPEVIAGLGDLSGKVLIDISNPMTPDFMALTIGHTTSAAEEIKKLAPQARVVKAFNTIFASLFALPRTETETTQVFYATDDEAAGRAVADLIRTVGFSPVHAGPLSNARYLEPLGELNVHFGYALGWGTHAAPAWIKLAA